MPVALRVLVVPPVRLGQTVPSPGPPGREEALALPVPLVPRVPATRDLPVLEAQLEPRDPRAQRAAPGLPEPLARTQLSPVRLVPAEQRERRVTLDRPELRAP